MLRSSDSPTAGGGPLALISPSEVIQAGHCIGCGVCVARATGAGQTAITMGLDRLGQMRPEGPRAWRQRRDHGFAVSCPFSPAADDEDAIAAQEFGDCANQHSSSGRFRDAYVGHVREGTFRSDGSSGGMVTWALAELLRTGAIDGAAHVVPSTDPAGDGTFFRYGISRSTEAITAGAKSRYYPVEMSAVLDEIRTVPGRYAIVGVPCFIKAVQLLRREDQLLHERIVCTVGLFCGHMKSARFVESFAWQMGVEIGNVSAVEFRRKQPERAASTYTASLRLADGSTVERDWWNLVDGDWGAGFFQHSACNMCDDVTAETADVSFGDAWVEPYSSDGRGTNVVITRSPAMAQLVATAVEDGRLQLERVDGDFIERTQAAGLRQRREGLAYRLTWAGEPSLPKRIAPNRRLHLRRKVIYRTRRGISRWSHRVFWLSRATNRPEIYVRWAALSQRGYHAIAYSRGRIGRWVDRWLPQA